MNSIFCDSQVVIYIDYIKRGQNGQRAPLSQIIEPTQREIAEKTQKQIGWIKLWSAALSTVSSRCGEAGNGS